ncbi:MAG: ATP synthase subunit I [Xanthomonadaceae bacterium]|nr:ATP synthase subunit I [Xanthomonadaceae bacterium]
MNPLIALALAWAAGAGLGLFYFGGLWLTVRKLTTRYSVPLFLASFVARTAVVVVGFYFVMGNRWERALVCLVGFIMVRQLLVSRLRSEPGAPAREESA